MKLYSIFDNVAKVFNKPFTEHNDQSATRSFIDSLRKQEFSDLRMQDYVLFRVGVWNDASGEITPNLPEKIYSGFDAGVELTEKVA